MLSVAEALSRILAGVERLGAEEVGLADALGRVLAEDVAARTTQPPAAVSSMDGYAVRAADAAAVPARLKLIGVSAAGRGFPGAVGPSEAVRIFTGAPLPAGADAVVIQEDTEAAGGAVTVKEAARPGAWVRPAGLDFRAGQVRLKAGRALTARDIGLAAAMNVPWLKVTRRPRVAVLATGDELAMPGEPLGPDQIISSNSVAVAAYVRVLGGEPVILGIARDTEDSLRAHLAGAAGADLLVTIGGASVGDYDLVQKVLGTEGLELGFYKVAMRPGKPLIFGRMGRTAVLGMPGNPVSAGVTAVVFLKPAVEKMLGLETAAGPLETALLGRDLPANDGRQEYMRARLSHGLDGALAATPFEVQDSSMMALFAEADCLVVRPPKAPPAKAGQRVEIVRLQAGGLSI
jgi:molybdopterin molybdotransferase